MLDRNSINLNISESEHYYKIFAMYNKNETRAVDRYLDAHFGRGNTMSFINTRIDGGLVLDNGMKIYIKKYPGYLKIKFNKDENSTASYKIIKDLGEGLKPVIQKQ